MAKVVDDLQPLARDLGIGKQTTSKANRKMATLFLLYSDEHKPVLNKVMEDTFSIIRRRGGSTGRAGFNIGHR